MLDPALLTEEQKTAIMTQFAQLSTRGIIEINQEMDDPINPIEATQGIRETRAFGRVVHI